MAKTLLHYEKREDTGKSVTRKLRSQGKIPAVVYGRGEQTFPITVDGDEFKEVISKLRGKLMITELAPPTGESFRAAIKSIQRHPLTEELLNIDFQKVHPGEMLHVSIPIIVHGTPAGLKLGGILEHIRYEIDVRGPVSKLPLNIDLDISGLDVGDAIRVVDVDFPQEVEVLDPSQALIITVVSPRRAAASLAPSAAELEAEVAEVEGEEGEAVEGEAAEGEAEAEGKRAAKETESKE